MTTWEQQMIQRHNDPLWQKQRGRRKVSTDSPYSETADAPMWFYLVFFAVVAGALCLLGR